MSTITTKDADDVNHQCAACGDSDDGGGSLKACTACNLVKYCNRACQVAHRPAHKKACKERVAELFDEKLFKQPPPNANCPLCYLRLPIEAKQRMYQSCCGKITCRGCYCAHEAAAADTEKIKCVFCRSEASSSDEEHIERIEKRVEADDAMAMAYLGTYYQLGMMGLRQDHAKALKLLHKSAKLGFHHAHYALSVCYQTGSIVEKDTRKATYHKQLGAMAGNIHARYNLGCDEYNAGNMDRAYKHWMISANDGCDSSMKEVQEGYKSGFVTKDDYAKTTRAYGNSIELFDEKLFKQPPPNENCPICYLRLPIEENQIIYQSCCGKMLCCGCVYAHEAAAADTVKEKCVFCRSEASSSHEEHIERMKKRVEADDAEAMFNLGANYQLGMIGLRQDHAKALELYHKSAKLGHHHAHFALSLYYRKGDIVEKDTRKATYHGQLGAMAGNVQARYNLGCAEGDAGNMDRAYKHWMMSANDGYDLSMKAVQEGHKRGFVTKDDYAKTIRAYGNSIAEMKSDDRDRAAAACLSKAE
jgi:hypothetical protein